MKKLFRIILQLYLISSFSEPWHIIWTTSNKIEYVSANVTPQNSSYFWNLCFLPFTPFSLTIFIFTSIWLSHLTFAFKSISFIASYICLMISFIASHIHSHIKSLSGWFAHLQEIRKRILANNFTDNLNNFLQIRKTHRPPP